MSTEIILSPAPELQQPMQFTTTPKGAKRVVEFFTAQINNDHTRKAYLSTTRRFAAWCDAQRRTAQARHHCFTFCQILSSLVVTTTGATSAASAFAAPKYLSFAC